MAVVELGQLSDDQQQAVFRLLLDSQRYRLRELEHTAIDEVHLLARWRRAFENFPTDPSIAQFAVLVADKPVGFIRVRVANNHQSHIEDLNIAAKFRGSGYARQLIDAALPWLQIQGATSLRAEIPNSNVLAQRLYADYGFELTAEANQPEHVLHYSYKIGQ